MKPLADAALRVQHRVLAKHGLDWATDARFQVVAKNGNGVHSLVAKVELARELFSARNKGVDAVLRVMDDHKLIAARK